MSVAWGTSYSRCFFNAVLRNERLNVLDKLAEISSGGSSAGRGNLNHMRSDLFETYTESLPFEKHMQSFPVVPGGSGYSSNQLPVKGVLFQSTDAFVRADPDRKRRFFVRFNRLDALDGKALLVLSPENYCGAQRRRPSLFVIVVAEMPTILAICFLGIPVASSSIALSITALDREGLKPPEVFSG
jgi:hypothetical protein